jgi:hypothetical protein
MPVSDGKVNVTAVLLIAVTYGCVAVTLEFATQKAALVQPELAKVMVTLVAALSPVILPPALVE